MLPIPSSSTSLGERWNGLARASGIRPEERLCVALSGGADSVFLLHLLAGAEPRPDVLAVHVDHGLRGSESREDARFCASLSRSLDIPFVERRLELDPELALDPEGPSLEARARKARYRVLAEVARSSGHPTILTGHHSDDILETLLQRWMRGTSTAGLYGPRRSTPPPIPVRLLEESPGQAELRVVRPLWTLRREEIRHLLAARGIAWREDSSNFDSKHTRSRIRHGLLPVLEHWSGPGALDPLRKFAAAAESLESELARSTASIIWEPRPHTDARNARGGVVPRKSLMDLVRPLRRRVLWRLLTEGTGTSPGRRLLEQLLDDLAAGRSARHTLPDNWSLHLRARSLVLQPAVPLEPSANTQVSRLSIPGAVTLPDERRLLAQTSEVEPDVALPRCGDVVELDASMLPTELTVRLPRSGDRFHALGAPGSKRLSRFFADKDVPREERGRIPVVLAGSEIVWIPGFAPAHRFRLRPETRRRLRLSLVQPAPTAPLGSGRGDIRTAHG